MLRIQLGLRNRVEDLRSWIDLMMDKKDGFYCMHRHIALYPEVTYSNFAVVRFDTSYLLKQHIL